MIDVMGLRNKSVDELCVPNITLDELVVRIRLSGAIRMDIDGVGIDRRTDLSHWGRSRRDSPAW